MTPTLVAVIACVVLVAISELTRIAIVRASDRRAAKIIAPLAAITAAYLATAGLAYAYFRSHGIATNTIEVRVEEVPPGYPATGKLERGDRIVALDGMAMTKSLSLLVDERGGAPVKLTFVRRGQTQEVTLQPVGHDGHWILGFKPSLRYVMNREPDVAVRSAIEFPVEQTKHLIPEPPPDAADPGGPKRIAQEFARSAEPTGTALALRTSLRFMVYILLLLVAANLVRIALAFRR